jgi:hypothetical protein
MEQELELVAECWHTAFATTATPSERQMLVWLDRYPLVIVEKALLKTGVKAMTMQRRSEPMSYVDRLRYASAVMRNLQVAAEEYAAEVAEYEAAEREQESGAENSRGFSFA